MTDSGFTVIEAQLNIDMDLQIVQSEYTVDGQGPHSVLSDYKGVRVVYLFSVIPT